MKVIHQQIYMPGMFGGIHNTTICGKVSHQGEDANVGKPTCKLCIRRIAGKHRMCRWIGWKDGMPFPPAPAIQPENSPGK